MLGFPAGVLPDLTEEDMSALDQVAADLIAAFRTSHAADGSAIDYWMDPLWYRLAADIRSHSTRTLGAARTSLTAAGHAWLDDGWWRTWADALLSRDSRDIRALHVLLTLDRPRAISLLTPIADELLTEVGKCGYWHDEMYDAALLLESCSGHALCAEVFDDEEYLRDTQLERARYGLGRGDAAMVAAVRDEIVSNLNEVRANPQPGDGGAGDSASASAKEEYDAAVGSLLDCAAQFPGDCLQAALTAEELTEIRALAQERAAAAYQPDDSSGLIFYWPRYEPALACAAALGWADVAQALACNATFEEALHRGGMAEERMCETALAWSLADPGPRALAVAARAMFPDSQGQRDAAAFKRAKDSLSEKWQTIGGSVSASVQRCRLGGAVAWSRCRG